MPGRISESLKSEVIRRWLRAESRNKIAAVCGISQGAVSGIIDEWKRSVGITLAEQLRALSIEMDRQGMSVVECAQGCRIIKILRNMGLQEDREESFFRETYSRCIEIGFRPEDIINHFSDMMLVAADFQSLGIRIDKNELGRGPGGDNSDNKEGDGVDLRLSQPIPTILQMRKYLEKVNQEIIRSELVYTEQIKETELLELKKSSIIQQTAAMLTENQLTTEKLDWFLPLKTELLAAGHSENDLELVLNAINLVKKDTIF